MDVLTLTDKEKLDLIESIKLGIVSGNITLFETHNPRIKRINECLYIKVYPFMLDPKKGHAEIFICLHGPETSAFEHPDYTIGIIGYDDNEDSKIPLFAFNLWFVEKGRKVPTQSELKSIALEEIEKINQLGY